MEPILFLPDANSSDRNLFGPPIPFHFDFDVQGGRLNRREEYHFLPQLAAIANLQICGGESGDGDCFYRAAAHQVFFSFSSLLLVPIDIANLIV